MVTAVSEERNVSCNVSSGEDSLNCSFSLEGMLMTTSSVSMV